ncbi:PilT protein domain protein [Xylanimonas cellulosilytica DSM 15894]|uniref:Ribonuclease VapC n=1 Tax=Xylanimonas cellulosilytica (strain DSM 15894 / JCM 12276 / CECT 5975 / KCTC 9989 / LMG 20990 / NBRC 107835 / XIL07) TaxID=446471 RepID=D1BU27_XYLCX|nr:type II toxin-antitoxin system VapC family toxin [Xylanimonas cellulosilytica]ACZ29191.1 PilT protein domain protein [Xylanimonas cellulosilytica DSM 15894]
MTTLYLLDTNVLIELLRGRGAVARKQLEAAEGRIGVSTISTMELDYGVERSSDPARSRQALDGLLSLMDEIPFDAHAAMHSGRIRAHLAAAGTPIGPYDVLIAGHARSLGTVLVTHNTDEFSRVPGLEIEDWLV